MRYSVRHASSDNLSVVSTSATVSSSKTRSRVTTSSSGTLNTVSPAEMSHDATVMSIGEPSTFVSCKCTSCCGAPWSVSHCSSGVGASWPATSRLPFRPGASVSFAAARHVAPRAKRATCRQHTRSLRYVDREPRQSICKVQCQAAKPQRRKLRHTIYLGCAASQSAIRLCA